MKKDFFVKVVVVSVVFLFSVSLGMAAAEEYSCLCTKCNHDWVSTTKPSKCPQCGNKGITCYKKSDDEGQQPNQTPQGDLMSETGGGPFRDDSLPDHQSAAPVSCRHPHAVKPIVVAAGDSPCPGGVYCNHDSCGEYCCEWGYFYSNPCDCRCYRSSYDAGANCNTYFRCN